MKGLAIKASATIEQGATTNRVKVKRGRKMSTPGYALVRYRNDPSVRNLPYVAISISIPVEELAAIDDAAEAAQMSRSHFLRQAAKHFMAKVGL